MHGRFLYGTPLILLGFVFLHIKCQQLSVDQINKMVDSFQKEIDDLFLTESKGQKPLVSRPQKPGTNPMTPSTKDNSRNNFVEEDSPAANRAKFSQAQPEAILEAKNALFFEKTALILLQSNITMPEDVEEFLKSKFLNGSKLEALCHITHVESFNPSRIPGNVPDCVKNIYRTINGTCNNPVQLEWGKSFQRYLRFHPIPAYSDGVMAPRNSSVKGSRLPSPRKVSRTVILNKPEGNKENDDHFAWSHFFALFGQFLDHDISNTPQFRASEKDIRPPKCCQVDDPHQECFSIDISDDPLYQKFNQSCMEFVRSLPTIDPSCKLGVRQQQNQVTAFIDGSQVYGSTDKEASNLKVDATGKLKFTVESGGHLLKNIGEVTAEECLKTHSKNCDFEAGDDRVNIVPSLVSMHTLWLRQHNRLVDLLKQHGWTDPEELYQETRRIVGAQLQHITYKEFLPIIFLKNLLKFKDLNLDNPVPYDITAHPGILNEFATAAFRFGHSMIKGVFTLVDTDLKTVQPDPNHVSDHYFFPYDVYEKDKLDKYLRGHMVDHSQETNNIMTDQLTNFLLKKPGSDVPALDLASLNIQRGRDHGLPSYIDYRKKCGLPGFTTFQQLKPIMLPKCDSLLEEVYEDVQDIDLWVGGLCEDPEEVGAVGPVFACIIGEQFSKLRRTDRFFYDRQLPPMSGVSSPFTKEQVAEIKKSTLGIILCLNANIEKMREEAMLVTGTLKDCSELIKNDMNMEVFNKTGKAGRVETPDLKLQQLVNAFKEDLVNTNFDVETTPDDINEPEDYLETSTSSNHDNSSNPETSTSSNRDDSNNPETSTSSNHDNSSNPETSTSSDSDDGNNPETSTS